MWILQLKSSSELQLWTNTDHCVPALKQQHMMPHGIAHSGENTGVFVSSVMPVLCNLYLRVCVCVCVCVWFSQETNSAQPRPLEVSPYTSTRHHGNAPHLPVSPVPQARIVCPASLTCALKTELTLLTGKQVRDLTAAHSKTASDPYVCLYQKCFLFLVVLNTSTQLQSCW